MAHPFSAPFFFGPGSVVFAISFTTLSNPLQQADNYSPVRPTTVNSQSRVSTQLSQDGYEAKYVTQRSQVTASSSESINLSSFFIFFFGRPGPWLESRGVETIFEVPILGRYLQTNKRWHGR